MDFVTAIKAGFSKYATFDGRAARSEYWWWILFNMLISIALVAISHPLQAIGSIALFLPTLAVSARRLHDVNRSAWFLLLPVPGIIFTSIIAITAAIGGPGLVTVALGAFFGLVTLGSYLILLIWFCQKGTAGANQYGEDPLTSLPHMRPQTIVGA